MILDGKRVLLTGATGSLGKAVLLRAKEQGWNTDFVLFSRDENKQSALKQKYPEYRYILGDVAKYKDIKRACIGVDTILHFAAYKQVPSAQNNVPATIETNVIGSQNVVDAAIECGVKQVVASSTDKACLDWHSRVLLEDGTTEFISKLVSSKYSGKVITVNPATGERTSAKVVGWHKNKLDGRKLYKISYEGASKHRGQFCGVVVTEDHLVLTSRGWKQARYLNSSDFIVTEEYQPNREQIQLLVGVLLGDASLSTPKNNKRSCLRLGHSECEKEWLDTSIKALDGVTFCKYQKRESLKRQPFYYADSSSSAFFTELYSYFYNGKKIVPRDLVETFFSPRLMSAWYMDDGCRSKNNDNTTGSNARLATHGFSKQDVEWLAEFLSDKGLECYEYSVVVSGKHYSELRFTVNGTKALFKYMENYILPCMYKKVDFPNTYDSALWDLGTAERYTSPAIVCKDVVREKKDVYCLDVEDTHTFVVNGVVVHNCAPVNAYGQGKALMEAIFQHGNSVDSTTFHLARYGNVVCSNGSVIPLFEKLGREGKSLTVTHPSMTRFWISIDTAVDLILHALDQKPGTIVVPKAGAMSVLEVAKTIAMRYDVEVQIGQIRAGEKIHEAMVNEAESFYVWQDDEHFYINPPTSEVINLDYFSYTSDKAPQMTSEELLKIIDNYHYKHEGYRVG